MTPSLSAQPPPDSMVKPSGYAMAPQQDLEPHIAIPSDIYHDFEALKSATKLDTGELMRKLLKDYQKMANSNHPSRERKLDDVIGDLVAARSSNILDLSKPKGVFNLIQGSEPGRDTVSKLGHGYTDDQLAMGVYDEEEDLDETDDVKPLDLTLHKHEPAPSPDSAIVEDIHARRQTSSPVYPLALNSYPLSGDTSQISHSLKPAGSYVINLEPSSESPSVLNSALARALQMDVPGQNLTKIQNYTIGPPETTASHKDNISHLPNLRNAVSAQVPLQNKTQSQSALFQEANLTFSVSKTAGHESVSGVAKTSVLPSYDEAMSSVLGSQPSGAKPKHESLLDEAGSKNVQECQTSAISFVHINAEDADIKFIPLNINTQLLAAGGTSQDQQRQQQYQQQQQNVLQHQLMHQHLTSEKKPLHSQLQHQLQQTSCLQSNRSQSASSTLSAGQISHIQMLSVPGIKTEPIEAQEKTPCIKSTEVSFPNFLLEPQSIGISSLPTSRPSSTAAPNTMSTASLPMPTFFMTASSSGGVGNMVAIPILHALPEGMTGLQPFAFAPHPIPPPQSTGSSCMSTPASSEMILATASSIASSTVAINSPKPPAPSLGELAPSSTTSFSPETMPSPPLTSPKPKPGRPRGRGGRAQSQKVQNKDMKLLTENTLFPGVYTSILKLPWSRRSRNKTKSKTISELKKQAQIIAHDKVNEEADQFAGVTDSQDKDVATEHDLNNDVTHSTTPSTIPQQVNEQCPTGPQGDQQQQQINFENQQQQQRYQQVLQQKQKDLEQQQRLHLQYHLRLQEEQRKLTKQIEQSYLNVSDGSSVPTSITVSTQGMVPVKLEIPSSELPHGDSSSPLLPTGINAVSDSLQFSESSLSKDHVMMVYSNADLNSPKKTPRKRGRPPKMAALLTKTVDGQVSFEMPNSMLSMSLLQQNEPDNFLNTGNMMPSSVISSAHGTVITHNNGHELSQQSQVPESSDISMSLTHQNSEDMDVDVDSEMTLEKKIMFLTNQIGIEMSKSVIPTSINSITTTATTTNNNNNNNNIVSNTQQNNDNEDNGNKDDTMYQEMKLATNKSLVDVKPRRKKVSRLLKSDENFMYATFKIKPKGLTPRKSRRRRNKDVLATTAAAAETIANLRQKTLQDCLTSTSSDSSRPPSMVAWKFHEQYPFSNEDAKDRKTVCATCGRYFLYETEDMVPQQCGACLLGHQQPTELSEDNRTVEIRESINDSELRAECCVTCGNVFQKHYSDPSARCDVCRNSAPTVIKSSKLFSFQDSPSGSISPVPSSLGAEQSMTSALLTSSSDTSPVKDGKYGDIGLMAKINNNHLFCSLCRMEFTKICDYLAHIRDTHDTKSESKSPLLSDSPLPNDLTRKATKVSKTKKSLAHKTLTCPVEDCPHFFRERKDLDLHFLKKHSSLGTCPHTDCGFSYTTVEQLDNHFRFDHGTPGTTGTNSVPTSLAGGGGSEEENTAGTEKPGLAASSSEKPLQCEFCDYRCRQKNALTWHMRKHPEAASQHRRYSSVSLE